MYAKVKDISVLHDALKDVNEQYAGNIRFKRGPEPTGQRWLFTLTVNDSKGPGGRRSHTGRRIAAACWHAHGHFFDAVFDHDPDAIIHSSGRDGVNKITRDRGNWEDWNVGSIYEPLAYSNACDCEV